MSATVAKAYVLPPEPEDYVGEVRVVVALINYDDERDAARGRLAADEIRRLEAEVVVDTGASGLVLPEDMVDALGLVIMRRTQVQHADDRVEERPVAGMVRVEVSGRRAIVDCVVGPPGSTPLLGQIVLEITDLLVDCSAQRLVPDPESPFTTRYSLR